MRKQKISKSEIQFRAEDGVIRMGDIFWDWEHFNGGTDGFSPPDEVARKVVEDLLLATLQEFGVEVDLSS